MIRRLVRELRLSPAETKVSREPVDYHVQASSFSRSNQTSFFDLLSTFIGHRSVLETECGSNIPSILP